MAWTAPAVWLTTSVVPVADTYISVADADLYFSGTQRNAAWSAISLTERDVLLKEATRWLEQLCWKGEPCSAAQVLKWPRSIPSDGCCSGADCTTIPTQLLRATAELALALHANPTALIPAGAASTSALGPIKRQKLDALEVEYFDPRGSGASSGAATTPAKGPLVLRTFPWLKDIIGCWLNIGSSNLVYRVRS